MKKVIVTGATGYTGSKLVKELLNKGIQVSIIARKTSKYDLLEEVKDKIEIFEYDMNLEEMIKFIKKTNADIVFHIAAMIVSEHNSQQVSGLIQSNILFPTHILEAMKEAEIKNIVNTGTYWQNYIDENYNPVNLYAATKEAFEKILEYYVEAEGFKAITLKLFDTYGEDDPRPKIMNLFKKIAQTGEGLDMSGGEQYLDLVHIDDVIKAYLKAAEMLEEETEIKHKKYFVSSGKQIKLKDLAKKYEEENNVKLNINWGKRPYRKREVMKPLRAENVI